MANPYHDSIGRFTTREGQLRNIQKAIANKDVSGYLAERAALEEADRISNFSPVNVTLSSIHPALGLKEDDLAEQARVLATGNKADVEYFVEERINRPEFRQLLADRDAMRDKAKKLNEEFKLLNEAWDNEVLNDYDVVREKGNESLTAYEDLQLLKQQTNEYKDITAPVVAKLAEMQQKEGTKTGEFREYKEDTLNNLEATGEFPSGSKEWLEQRQNGIGGSDVGKIVGVDSTYATRDYQDVLESKIKPITQEEIDKQASGHTDYTGYTGRGNAWEDAIANKFSENHPELNITHCKTSWRNKNTPHQFANFDGLMADENGHPNGILEIKTASDPTKWGNPEDGLDAVPAQYRAQTLWYAQAAGFNKGAIAVMIDDHEYREYHFTMTPELKAEAASNLDKVNTFVKEIESRKDGSWVEQQKKAIKGFSKKKVKEVGKGDLEGFKDIAIYREEHPTATRRRFFQLCKDVNDEQQVRGALRSLFTEVDPSTRTNKFVGIDLETTNTTPTNGRIIEAGLVVKNVDGTREDLKQLYGIPKKAMKATSTGAEHVHHITPGMISKKRQFSHPEVQKEVLDKLMNSTMVAHNAGYEKRFLRQHLKGFAEAERAGKIKILDTRTLTQQLLPDTANNTLESLTNYYGISYAGAHRAHADADFMMESLERLQNDLYKEN